MEARLCVRNHHAALKGEDDPLEASTDAGERAVEWCILQLKMNSIHKKRVGVYAETT